MHALPVSAALGEAFPHLELTWVVEDLSAEVVQGNPYLREVIVLPRNRWKKGRLNPRIWNEYLAFLRDLRLRRFDLSLDLHGHGKSALLVWGANAPHRYGWSRLKDGAQRASQAIPPRPESVHRVDWFLDVARAFGANPERIVFPLAIPDEARKRVHDLLCAAQIDPKQPYLVLNPSGSNPVRRWSVARYAEVLAQLGVQRNLPCVLVGSSKDRELTQAIAATLDASAGRLPLLDLAGRTNLKELAALLEGASAHLCGDTGSAHIAVAVGCPVIGLYGPSDPNHAGPWGQEANVLSHRNVCGRGCSERACALPKPTCPGVPLAHCLAQVSPQQVVAKTERILESCRL
jgi:heptosyltransferase-1